MSNEIIAEVAVPSDKTDVLSVLEELTEQNGVIMNVKKNGGKPNVRLSFPDDRSLLTVQDYCTEQGVTMDVRRLVHETDSE